FQAGFLGVPYPPKGGDVVGDEGEVLLSPRKLAFSLRPVFETMELGREEGCVKEEEQEKGRGEGVTRRKKKKKRKKKKIKI
ncbi:hypothetical protein OFL98_28195, partial [Escherichia coli]|nr:hypothetical protein [Escherichia coli]